MFNPLRWTVLVCLFPSRYVSDHPMFDEFPFQQWSKGIYKWDRDDWSGYKDIAQSPTETVARGDGDCEDYALVAASWSKAQGRSPTLGWCFDDSFLPIPKHVVAYDEKAVYSSGNIYTGMTIEEYIDTTRYEYCLEREIKT